MNTYWMLISFRAVIPQEGYVYISASSPEEAEAALRANLGDDVTDLLIMSVSTEPPTELTEEATEKLEEFKKSGAVN